MIGVFFKTETPKLRSIGVGNLRLEVQVSQY